MFDGENPAGYREDDTPTQAVNAYGSSKRAGEKALLRNEHGKLHAYLVRTSWLYGPNGKNFVDSIVKLAREKNELHVVNDQHGKPTYTFDLAAATRELLDSRSLPGTYHVTNETPPEGITWYDFAREVVRLSGSSTRVIPCASEEYPRPARRPTYSMLMNTKLSSRRPWKAALEEYLHEIA